MSLIGSVYMYWYYPDCAVWSTNKTYSTIDHLRFELLPTDRNRMWWPTIINTNNAVDINIVDKYVADSDQLYLYSTGRAVVRAVGQFDSFCRGFGDQLVKFPFDTQSCTLDFLSYLSVKEVEFSNQGNF